MQDDPQLDVVQHPTLGTLKFPKDMPPEERNAAIERLESQSSASAAPQPQPGIASRIQSSFDAETKDNPSDPLLKTGLKSTIRAIGTPFIHPVQTAVGIGKAAVDGMNPLAEGPNIASAANQTYKDYKAGGAGYVAAKAAGEAFGGLALGEAGGEVFRGAPRIPGAVSAGADRFMQTAYPKNMALAPAEASAQGFVKALVPPVKAVNRITSAAPEIPTALDFAQRSKMPINGKLDFAKAAEGAGQELQDHFDNNILGPHKNTSVASVPPNYNGARIGAGETKGTATLGQINDRVNSINRDLKSNYRQALDSQTGPVTASDAALNAEKRGLTELLHNKLGELNGIMPEDVASVRQRAGKLRTLAEETRLSGNADTVAEGRADTGGNIGRMSHAVIDKVGGGREVIGNRIFKNALSEFQPQNTLLPQPSPPVSTPASQRPPVWQGQGIQPGQPPTVQPVPDPALVRAGIERFQGRQAYKATQTAANQAAAQREFLHSNNLEQAAQDAAADRNATATSTRMANAAESYKARTGRKSPLYPPSKGK